MTISATEPLVAGPFNGNGVTTVFNFSMTIFSEDEVLVFLRDANGVETLQTLTTDYTVAPTGGTYPAAGGSVAMVAPPPVGVELVILPDITRSQDRPFSSQSSITLQEVEDALDKLTAITRQLYERSLRAVTVSAFDPGDVDQLLANVNALIALETDIQTLVTNLTAIQTVNTNIANVNTVATNIGNVNAVGPSIASVNTVAADIVDVVNTGFNIASVVNVSNNMANVIDAARLAFDEDNRIINGSFEVWQRGLGPVTTAGYVAADRWRNVPVGGTVTMTGIEPTLGLTLGGNNPRYIMRQTVSGQTLTTHAAAIEQRIEGVRTYADQTITLVFWARRISGAGNMAVEFFQDFGTGGSPSAAVTGLGVTTIALTADWTAYKVTLTVPSISGKTRGSNNDDYLSVQFWTSAGSSFNARTNSLGLQTIGIDLWGVHIVHGDQNVGVADRYRAPTYAQELKACERYYEQVRGGSVGVSTAASGQFIGSIVNFATAKRIVPAVARLGDVAIANVSTPYADHIGNVGFRAIAQVTATGPVGFVTRYGADAEL